MPGGLAPADQLDSYRFPISKRAEQPPAGSDYSAQCQIGKKNRARWDSTPSSFRETARTPILPIPDSKKNRPRKADQPLVRRAHFD
jgi:hypothetical protein